VSRPSGAIAETYPNDTKILGTLIDVGDWIVYEDRLIRPDLTYRFTGSRAVTQ